ncbi:aminotransferase class V-fold PLP-dependent enzyme [Aerococcaceae bacterium WGS1372]
MINKNIRSHFPGLNQSVNNEPLIYFDHAATSQTPTTVVDALTDYYTHYKANIHRGIHQLAQRATDAYENSRKYISHFMGAQDSSEIIFTSGTTQGINLIARGLVEPLLEAGDIILTSRLEHHSNLVPWQEVAKRTRATLQYLDLDDATQVIDLEALKAMDKDRLKTVKVIAIQHVSNVLGVEQPIKALCQWAHQHGILVVVDGAQALPHMAVDVSDLGVDAYCFSGHKAYGPTGIGVCYLNKVWHDQTQPVNFGGEMIHYVGDFESNYKDAPWKFEAGTPPIAQAIALQTALEFIESVGYDAIHAQETALAQRLYKGLQTLDGIELYQSPATISQGSHGIVCFNFKSIHPHDVATAYDMEGIAVRAGHHCAQVLMRQLDVAATLRASMGVYNTMEEVDRFIASTQRVKEFFEHVTI